MLNFLSILAILTLVIENIGCGRSPALDGRSASELSSEVDSFTPRVKGADKAFFGRVQGDINQITGSYLDEAIAWANQEPGCDGWCMALILSETLASSGSRSLVSNRLISARRGYPFRRLGGIPTVPGWRGYFGAIESLVSKGKSYDGRYTLASGAIRLGIRESIFRDISRLDSPGSFLEVGAVLPVVLPEAHGGMGSFDPPKEATFLIGSDKFGHFLATGFEYLEAYLETLSEIKKTQGETPDAETRALFATLLRGVLSEVTLLGGWTARVFSYADLAANYSGFIFFREIVEGHSPYLSRDQVTGQWRRGPTPFVWENFMDAGWDEGINCSHYYPSVLGRDDFQRKIADQIVHLSQEAKENLTCPIGSDACANLWRFYQEKYGIKVAETLVSPQCSEEARGMRPKTQLTTADLDKDRPYYESIGFYSGTEITRRSKEWCMSSRDKIREARCERKRGEFDSLESCLKQSPRNDVEAFRCEMDGTDLAGWAL